MDESRRNQVGVGAGIQALKDQRNEALDRLAQVTSELMATRAELEEARAQIAELTKESGDGGRP